jgi:hypothetical protein
MRRRERSARCALMSRPGRLELRVVVDGETLLVDRCARAEEAFTLAERWKHRMIEKGWQQVVPRAAEL